MPDGKSKQARLKELMSVLELDAVRTLRVEAEVLDLAAALNLSGSLEREVSAEVQAGRMSPTSIGFKLVHEDTFSDEAGTEGARVALDFLLVLRCPEDLELDQDDVEIVANNLVMRVTHPYYREAVSSMLSRIGAKGLTIGLMRFKSLDDEDDGPSDD